MTDQFTPYVPDQPEVALIPYVEAHTGPRRTLIVDTSSAQASGLLGTTVNPPSVAIDGRHFMVFYGKVGFEVPADRAVHVAVYVEGREERYGEASTLLLPDQPAVLVWRLTRGTLEVVGTLVVVPG